jgi:hypothetical protein
MYYSNTDVPAGTSVFFFASSLLVAYWQPLWGYLGYANTQPVLSLCAVSSYFYSENVFIFLRLAFVL